MRVLIVDDEFETREGLRDLMEWDGLGVREVLIAPDGIEALTVCRETEPDIIISDIRMPKMDGMVFIERVSGLLPSCKIILMSAYTDKSYLKYAIKFKAVSYVEKPINISEMTDAVRASAEMLRRERSMLSMIRGNTEFTHKITLALTKPLSDSQKTLRDIESVYPDFLTSGWYCTLIIKTSAQSNGLDGRFSSADVENEALREALASVFSSYLMAPGENRSIIAHVCDKGLSGELSSRRLFYKVAEIANLKLRDGVFISVGGSVMGAENIWKSYIAAAEAAESLFFSGYGTVVFYSGRTVNSGAQACDDYTQVFENHLRRNDRDGAMETLEEMAQYVRRCRGIGADSVRNTCFNLAMSIPSVGRDRNLTEYKTDSRDFIWKSVAEKETFQEIYDDLIQKTDDFFSALEYVSIRKPVCRVIMYIEQNYAKKSLTIQEIAENIHLTPAHICHLFKREMGKTVNQHLNNYRIDKAKILLKSHELKLSAVAAQVGYSDANYFMRIFKKTTGVTPSEYREQYLLR